VVNPGWVRADLRTMTPMGQRLSSVCWLTGYEMLYTWKGLDPKTIPDKLKAAGVPYDQACITGLRPVDNYKAAKALGLTPAGFGQRISSVDLKERLRWSPLWLAGEWFPSALHVRVVTGASENWVEYIDPWYGGTSGLDLTHKDMIDVFIQGDGNHVRGTDALIGNMQMSYWKP
jgi:Papain-like cysteine protease AvrRpt2